MKEWKSGGNTGKILSVSPQKVCKSLGKVGAIFLQKSLNTCDSHRNEEKKLIRQENVKVFSKKKKQEEL